MTRSPRIRVANLVALTGLFAAGGATTPAIAETACVAIGSRCYPTLAMAVDAAKDGDVVRIPAGRFTGGLTVTASITLAGAGAERSIIFGGGPVLTIGTFGAATEPTVRISGVTLTGGATHSSPVSTPFTGVDSVVAAGGGLEIPPSASFGGATVTVSRSVIRGNLVAPLRTRGPTPEQEPHWPRCPAGFCRFAAAQGGGIDNWGRLTLLQTTVSDNVAAGDVTSDANGGGVVNHGSLKVDRSSITGNRAVAVAPYGRFAEGGGIFGDSGSSLLIRRSSVSGNLSRLEHDFPYRLQDGTIVDSLANGGGIHIGDDAPVTIEKSAIDDNTLIFRALHGQWGAINSGLQVGASPLTLRDTSVSRNRLVADVATTADAGPLGGAMEWDDRATITGLRVTRNTAIVRSQHGAAGNAATVAALAILAQGTDPGPSTLTDSLIADNIVTAVSHGGPVTVVGAGLVNDSSLEMRHVTVRDNLGIGRGVGGILQGGGIWNGAAFGFQLDPLSRLSLVDTTITGNALVGARGQGGGLYTELPVSRRATVITGNRPGQCHGCGRASSAVGQVVVQRSRRPLVAVPLRPRGLRPGNGPSLPSRFENSNR